jgi:hypothetical protein
MRKGHVRKFRKGFNTTHKTKITACSQVKHMLETQKMKIYSKPLISELKTFVAHGVGFGAKTGEHDDLVSAMLLIIRMAGVLSDWDPKIYEKMTEKLGEYYKQYVKEQPKLVLPQLPQLPKLKKI